MELEEDQNSSIEFSDDEDPDMLGSKEEELPSSPIMNSEVDTKVRFALRVKTGLKSLDEFYNLIIGNFDAKYVIVSVEKKETPDQHFHIYLGYDKIVSLVGLRKQLKEFLLGPVGIPPWPPKKGNAVYSCAFSTGNYEKYTLKDGEYKYLGFTETTIKALEKSSYKKFQKNEFRAQLNIIEDKYMSYASNDMVVGYYSIDNFIEDYINLKTAYKQTIVPNTIMGYARMMYFRKNKDEVKKFSRNMGNKIREELMPF